MSTTAAVIARVLSGAGIDRVFGLPGGEVLVLIDELRRAGVDFVLMRHEANAGIAAAVYGKLRGQPGVVLTHAGPGRGEPDAAAEQRVPGSRAAARDLGADSRRIPGEPHASALPLHDVYRPVDALRGDDHSAERHRGRATRAGGVHGAAVRRGVRDAVRARGAEARGGHGAGRIRSSAGSRPIGRLRGRGARAGGRRCGGAKRPLVVVGLAIDPANAARLRAWLDAWNLPVAVTPKVKGIVDETAANFVGVVGGMAADDVMCDALPGGGRAGRRRPRSGGSRQDVARRAGRFDWVLDAPNVGGGGHRAARRRARGSRRDPRGAGRSQPPPAAWDAPFDEFQTAARRDCCAIDPAPPARCGPGTSSQALAAALPPETIVTTDVGSHKYLFGQYWPSRHPETFWMSNGLSGMAYGLSAAIGAQARAPGRHRARGGRRRRLLDERPGARDRGARRRAVHHRGARGRQLLADQAVAGRERSCAVRHGLRADRHREDGGGVRRRKRCGRRARTSSHRRPRARPARGGAW